MNSPLDLSIIVSFANLSPWDHQCHCGCSLSHLAATSSLAAAAIASPSRTFLAIGPPASLSAYPLSHYPGVTAAPTYYASLSFYW